MMSGIITPGFKKKGSSKSPDNYRRITVTSLIGKVLEMAMVTPVKLIIGPKLNKLQRGFCDNASAANTGFILSECIAESSDQKKPMYITFLDASKAFHVV